MAGVRSLDARPHPQRKRFGGALRRIGSAGLSRQLLGDAAPRNIAIFHMSYLIWNMKYCHLPSNSFRYSFAGAGGILAASRFSSTCATSLIPTSATAIPGVERVN